MSAAAKVQRAVAKGALTRALNALEYGIRSESDLDDIARMVDKAEAALEGLCARHEEYLGMLESEGQSSEGMQDYLQAELDRTEIIIRAAKAYRKRITEDRLRGIEEEKAAQKARLVAEESRLVKAAQTELNVASKALAASADAQMNRLRATEDVQVTSVAVLDTCRLELLRDLERLQRIYTRFASLAESSASEEETMLELSMYVAEASTKTLEYISSQHQASSRIATGNAPHRYTGHAKMEAVPIPSFKGTYATWPTFITSWKKIVERHYPNEFWAVMLKEKLCKEAQDMVSGCDDNYDEMMKRLARKYGDKRKVVEAIMQEIREVKPLSVGNHIGLLKLIDRVEKADMRLKSLEMQQEISTSAAMADIERRLPEDVRNQWARHLIEKSDEERSEPYKLFLPFLLKEKERVEYLTSSTRKVSSVSTHFQGLQLESQAEAAASRNHSEAPGSGAGRPLWRCYKCNQEGHIAKNCRKRSDDYGRLTGDGLRRQGKRPDNKPKDFYRCAACKGNSHLNKDCLRFKEGSVKERKMWLMQNGSCFRCFGNHLVAACKGSGVCQKCQSVKHHTMICLKVDDHSQSSQEDNAGSSEPHGQSKKVPANFGMVEPETAGSDSTLLHIMNLQGQKRGTSINTFWDTGSGGSFITHKSAAENKFTGVEEVVDVRMLQGHQETLRTLVYTVTIKDRDERQHSFPAYGVDNLTGEISAIDMKVIGRIFPGTPLTDLRRPCGEVDLLIGNNKAGWQPQPIRSDGEHLLIMENIFGRCLGGTHPELLDLTKKLENCWVDVTKAESSFGVTSYGVGVKRHVEERDTFFQAEALGTQVVPKCGGCRCGGCPIPGHTYSFTEERELCMIREGLSYDEERGVWIAQYPWIVEKEKLQDNYGQALGALRSCENNLERNPQWKEVYAGQVQDMIDRGAARKLSSEEVTAWGDRPVFYLCHLAALNPRSSSTPVRIVFDSSRQYGKFSLNSCLAKGPDNYMNNILGVFCRFREESFAIQCDVKKMYNSVEMAIDDQHCHRFLWRNCDVTRAPDIHIIRVVNIGDRPAGTIAMEAMFMTADKFAHIDQRAADVIKNSSYVDDLMDSCEGREKGLKTAEKVEEILRKGNFQIKYWRFSGEAPTGEETSLKKVADPKDDARVLGVIWDPAADVFKFETKLNFSKKKKKVRTGPNIQKENLAHELPEVLTRRSVMSQVLALFDPCGFLVPVTMKSKVLLRETWILKLDWDDPLPSSLRQKWFELFTELFQVQELTFTRCLKPRGAVGKPILVILSDASETAFGAVAYVRWELETGGFSCHLIMSKGKIAPVKEVSIPRLELNAAVVGKRIRRFIETEMRYEFAEVVHLLDSLVVLGMLNKINTRFPTYIGVRVAEVQAASKQTQSGILSEWAWIEGPKNISDWLTRGRKPSELSSESEWQKGPSFLYQPRSEWPIKAGELALESLQEEGAGELGASTGETVTCGVIAVRIEPAIQIQRFSKLPLLLRVTARIMRIMRKATDGKRHINGAKGRFVSSDEIQEAKMYWVRQAQATVYQDLQASVPSDEGEKPTGPFARLALAKVNNVWIVGSRMRQHVSFTWDNKPPIFLPSKHKFTRLLMVEAHREGHLGSAATLSKFRREYWVPHGFKLAKSVRNKCVICRKADAKPAQQIMGEIPKELLMPAPAWSYIGVDLFGPYSVRGEVNKRTTAKAYGVMFVCLLTKAVHIEVASSYATDSFLACLRRFAAVRGWPQKVFSDGGSQLQGANKDLAMIWDKMKGEEAQDFGVQNGLEWKISPADAPWYQGTTERLIGTAKRCIHMAVGDHRLTHSELQTVFYEAMQLMNERPIGVRLREGIDGPMKALTPNDLLLGRASSRVPAGPWNYRIRATDRFRIIQDVVDSFWARWTSECAPALVIRQKWHQNKRDFRKGDVVLIVDSNAKRGHYKMAVVDETIRGTDGKVRECHVKYKHSDSVNFTIVRRPVQRLVVVLPVEEQGNRDSQKREAQETFERETLN